MWIYEKRLQYPIRIKTTNAAFAKIIMDQYGGPDGELGASMRYLTQRYSMPYDKIKGLLTDIGTEELAHMEMICSMVRQLTRDLTPEQIKKQGFSDYLTNHGPGLYPASSSGVPFNALTFQSKGDAIADIIEDMAAEQKARKGYDNLLTLIDDPDVKAPLIYLREREIVHFQRFGEALNRVTEKLGQSNVYFMNPAFPKR